MRLVKLADVRLRLGRTQSQLLKSPERRGPDSGDLWYRCDLALWLEFSTAWWLMDIRKVSTRNGSPLFRC
jgi:hypothetical protein